MNEPRKQVLGEYLVVPLVRRAWIIRNNCTGFGVQVIGASGIGTVVAAGMKAIVVAQFIDLMFPDTRGGVQALEAYGLIAELIAKPM